MYLRRVLARGGMPLILAAMVPRLPASVPLLAALAAAGCGAPPEAVHFEEIGSRRLTEIVEPDSYLLLALGYRAAGGVHEILVSELLAEAPPSVKSDLAAVLGDVEAAMQSAGGDGGAAAEAAAAAAEPPLWTYRLGVRERWIADLEISSGAAIGPLGVLARVNGREARLEADAPALARWLRSRSLETLRAVMARPRSAQAWSLVALAEFLGAAPPEALRDGGAAGLRREVLDGLRAARDPRPIAEVLIEKTPWLRGEELRSVGGRTDDLSVRVLLLTRAAWDESRDALKEILTLSLEYHDEVLLFEKALRALFPAASNAWLLARHPPSGDKTRAAAFIREIHEGLARVSPVEGGGWRLAEA